MTRIVESRAATKETTDRIASAARFLPVGFQDSGFVPDADRDVIVHLELRITAERANVSLEDITETRLYTSSSLRNVSLLSTSVPHCGPFTTDVTSLSVSTLVVQTTLIVIAVDDY